MQELMIGTFLLDMTINGRKLQHEVVVIKHLTDYILGADFMQGHHLSYDAYTRNFSWGDNIKQWTNAILSSFDTVTIPAFQTKIIKIDSINDQAQKCEPNTEAIAFITFLSLLINRASSGSIMKTKHSSILKTVLHSTLQSLVFRKSDFWKILITKKKF